MDKRRLASRIYRDKRWAAVRLQAKRRDGWRCVKCGARTRLEVDHIRPLVARPDLAFSLDNLQSLCVSCHSQKTARENAWNRLAGREDWLELIQKT